MKNRTIIVTREDHAKLQALLDEADGLLRNDLKALRVLADKLNDARIVAPDEIPADVITLYSRAELLDLDEDEELDLTIVPPYESDASQNKISVLAPIGVGMLGYRVGDVFEQSTPRGACRFQILGVLYQPEAAQANASSSTRETTLA